MVQAPTRDASDFCIAHSADPALFMPEKAQRTSAPKRFLHMGSFALFEVDFIGGVVGVRVTFDFNVSLDGDATGVVQPNLAWLPIVIARFTEEGPVTTTTQRKVLLFAPAGGLVWCLRRAHQNGNVEERRAAAEWPKRGRDKRAAPLVLLSSAFFRLFEQQNVGSEICLVQQRVALSLMFFRIFLHIRHRQRFGHKIVVLN